MGVAVETVAAKHGFHEGEGVGAGRVRGAGPGEDGGERAGDEQADGSVAEGGREGEIAEELVAVEGGAEIKGLARGACVGGGGQGRGGQQFFGDLGDPGGGESGEITGASPHGIFAGAARCAAGERVDPRENLGGIDRERRLKAARGIGSEAVFIDGRGERPERAGDVRRRRQTFYAAGPGADLRPGSAGPARDGEVMREAGDEHRWIEIASKTSLGGDQWGSARAADAGEDTGALDRSRDGDTLAVVEEARRKKVASDRLGRAAGARVDGAMARFAEVGAPAVDEGDGRSSGRGRPVIGQEDLFMAVASVLNFGEERAGPGRLDRAEDHRSVDTAATSAAVAMEGKVREDVEPALCWRTLGLGRRVAFGAFGARLCGRVVGRAVFEEIGAVQLVEEGAERRDAGVRAFAASGEDDALQIARAVGGGEEAPLARAELDQATGALIVEDDDGHAAGDVAAREDMIREAGASGEGVGHPRVGRFAFMRR